LELPMRAEPPPGPRPDGTGHVVDDGVITGYPDARGRGEPLILGQGAWLRSGTVIYDGTIIGTGLQTGHGVVIREGCAIGDDVAIWTNAVIDYGCRIGNRVKIHCNCYVAQYTELADDVFLAPGVTIANDLYPGDARSAEVMSGPRIGQSAQIGVNCTILPFVEIGAGSLIGAGSVVTRDIPAGAVAFGNPAAVHGTVADLPDVAGRIAPVPWSAARYRLLADPGPGAATGGSLR
jgi:acetyltransferase-like isoleucine patch superfamily enzyme